MLLLQRRILCVQVRVRVRVRARVRVRVRALARARARATATARVRCRGRCLGVELCDTHAGAVTLRDVLDGLLEHLHRLDLEACREW